MAFASKRTWPFLPAEWPYLRAATLASGPRDGMNPVERVALYAVAIQTGLRSAELRSLTKADLFLAGEQRYVRCRAENTKNKQEARQYIQVDLAEELRGLVANKTPTANVFPMPDEFHVAEMLRGDLAAARKQWLDEMKHDPDARARREESDFLAVVNHQGEELDFHALRHTTGAWLALQGEHPNVIKTVMRHSTITLTMDTYGHLLPEQHAEAIGGMVNMLACKTGLAATGTAGSATAPGAAPATQNNATGCEPVRAVDEPADMPQTLEFPRKSGDDKAKTKSAPCRTRTNLAKHRENEESARRQRATQRIFRRFAAHHRRLAHSRRGNPAGNPGPRARPWRAPGSDREGQGG